MRVDAKNGNLKDKQGERVNSTELERNLSHANVGPRRAAEERRTSKIEHNIFCTIFLTVIMHIFLTIIYYLNTPRSDKEYLLL